MSDYRTMPLSCFTAYDVRGRVPDELNREIIQQIGLAFADQLALKKVVVGRDMRLSSPEFAEAVMDILQVAGVDVLDLGLAGTEEVYHAVFSGEGDGVDGGIMVTASHNPADYNGMKLVGRGATPVSSNSGLLEIARKAGSTRWYTDRRTSLQGVARGKRVDRAAKDSYIRFLLSFVDQDRLLPMRIVVNAGNGCAGPVIDLLEEHLPCSFIKLNHEPDGTFPNGVPNPLLPEKREDTARAVREHDAAMGIAWDGDFDRCFLYDESGRFIEGYYIVGLLARAMLARNPGETILHDPRLIWNTVEIVEQAGGIPVMTRTGHAFIKEKMREVNGVYGGEMSAHHYFRDFGYCDTGMVPWLLVYQLLSETGVPLGAMVNDRMKAYPVSGEINSRITDPDRVIAKLQQLYNDGEMDLTDGLSVAYPDFRFNLRKSNTEPVLRLNVETRGDSLLLQKKTDELLSRILQDSEKP